MTTFVLNLVDVQEDQIVCTKCDKLQRLVIQEGVHASDPEFPFSGGRVFEASNRVMEVPHTVRRSGLNIADRIYFVYARGRGSTP